MRHQGKGYLYSGSEVEVGQRDRQMQRAWVGRKYMILGELRGTRQPESKKQEGLWLDSGQASYSLAIHKPC